MNVSWKIILISGLVVACVAACRLKPSDNVTDRLSDATPFDSVSAAHYQNFCAGCHGDNMEEFADRKWMFASTPEEIASLIKNGEESMGMPGFSKAFNDKEIKALTAHIIQESSRQYAEQTSEKKSDEKKAKKDVKVWADVIVTGLDSPWGLEFLPDGDLLIAERNGHLSRFTPEKERIEITGLPPIRTGGQGGLMDLQLHPDYDKNGWIYMSYSYFDEKNRDLSNTAIIRARLKEDSLTDLEYLYKGRPTVSTHHHFGSRIAFDGKGYMYFSIGERGRRDEFPQSIDNSNGKIHRLFDDGRIPPDNPFVNVEGAEKSIYSYGHRNPQGLSIHPVTGEIWESEHGPRGGDEINLILKGQNYGWPVISFGINYDGTIFTTDTAKEGMMQPVYYYVPSIAPCGQTFLTSTRYKGWENNLLIGSLRFQYLERVALEGHKVVETERLLEGIGRVRNVRVSPDGYIYVAVEQPGKILKLIPVDDR